MERDMLAQELEETFDAVVLCTGSTVPRDLPIAGRDLKGVHFAMDFLSHQNKVISGELPMLEAEFNVAGQEVVVIGGARYRCRLCGYFQSPGSQKHHPNRITEQATCRQALGQPLARMANDPEHFHFTQRRGRTPMVSAYQAIHWQ